MVSKLIKYEIRRTLRWYLIILAAGALIVGLATLAAALLPASLGQFFAVLGLLAAFAVSGVVPIWLGIDFYRSSYSKTGYLTRALPVKGTTIYWVKLGYVYVLSLLSLVATAALGYVASIGISIAGGGTAGDVTDAVVNTMRSLSDMLPGWAIAVLVVFLLLWPLVWIAAYFFAATVGSEAWSARMGIGGPIVVWVIFYTVSQIVGVAGAFIPLHLVFGAEGVELQFTMINLFTMESDNLLPLGVFIMMVLVSIAAIIWGAVSFDRKVELR